MPGPSGERCDTCYFWGSPESEAATPTDEYGSCRFQLLLYGSSDGRPKTAFPKIKGFGWCGQWKPMITPEVVQSTREWVQE